MREIKFRGKRVDNGEWVYGVPVVTSISGAYMVSAKAKSKGGKGGIVVRDVVVQHEVDPETVGQYTGLKDKNGTEIYEGDVVTTDIKRPYLIVDFRDGCFMFNCNDGGEDYYDIMVPITKEPHDACRYCEVIGNIHDNHELIGGAE